MTHALGRAAVVMATTAGLALAGGAAAGAWAAVTPGRVAVTPGRAATAPGQAVHRAAPARRVGQHAATAARWRVAYRSTSRRGNQINAVAAVSGRYAWAVGARTGTGGLEDQPLALRWNGRSWRSVTVPGVAGSYLTDVAASTKSDVWVFAVPGGGVNAKAVRWNGTRWQDIPLPAGEFPDDVAVLKPGDAWLAGSQQACTGSGASQVCATTLYHWDGSTWSPFTVPIVVSALSASGPDHVWVTGTSRPCDGQPCSIRVRVYNWNGSAWRKTPGFPRVYSRYQPGLAMTSGRNVWVGTWATRKREHPGRLLHWNGSRWRTISAPRSLTTETPLVTDGGHGVWLGPWAHWTGTRWVSTLASSPSACGIASLARIPGRATLWGAGWAAHGGTFDGVVCSYPRTP
jgi:hypothetical protein